MTGILQRRLKLQNDSDGTLVEVHWGYPNEAYPCDSDAGSCEYFEDIYHMHDIGVLYTCILWAVIVGILFIWLGFRTLGSRWRIKREIEVEGQVIRTNGIGTVLGNLRRRWLLPEVEGLWRRVFGNVSRLQVLILAVLSGYLVVFSLVGIVYKTWHTPIKAHPNLHNTRLGMGGFADRVGTLSFALTPLTILLSTRSSLLTLLTGLSYQNFNFLHRWTGRIIFLQSFLHILGWTIIEGILYQPQPYTYKHFISQQYIIFGILAMFFLVVLVGGSFGGVVRWMGYEVWRKVHYGVGALYLGACWGHWDTLACWMVASIVVMFLDRALRVLSILLIHFKILGTKDRFRFKPAQATIITFQDSAGMVIRIDFEHDHSPWIPGSHFFLCFPSLSIWQSHPFTVLTSPSPPSTTTSQKHTYIIRACAGQTSLLPNLANSLLESGEKTTPVILTGPYGTPIIQEKPRNLLAVAGGTGITLAVPLALEAARVISCEDGCSSDILAVHLVWIIREVRNLEWIMPELGSLKTRIMNKELSRNFKVRVFVTGTEMDLGGREKMDEGKEARGRIGGTDILELFETDESFMITFLEGHRPDLKDLVDDFVGGCGGLSQVVGSGPKGMGTELRAAVASYGSESKVWKGDDRSDVTFYWDER